MGRTGDEIGAGLSDDDTQQHPVQISRSFIMMQWPVSQDEWDTNTDGFSWSNPSNNTVCEYCPVESVTWFEALSYANLLSAEHSLDTCYELECTGVPGEGLECTSVDFVGVDCTGYRLPTEAEWEYAARGTEASAFYTGMIAEDGLACPGPDHLGDAGQCCYTDTPTDNIASNQPNEFGLYDMIGNVGEWTTDAFLADYERLADTDPFHEGDASSERVYKGALCRDGSGCDVSACTHSTRNRANPDFSAADLGFRLVRTRVRQ